MVGQVGVAVGHEIRNPLTTVRGFLQMLGSEKNYEGAREYFSLMIEEIDKADATISHLINLANNKTNNPENLNLNNIVHECLSGYLDQERHSNIKIETRLNDIPDILIDKLEVRELIENLLINAIEAMPDGGTITVNTDTFDNEVLLIIQDQGTGISIEAAKCIGTPFFTTKETSAGLGLAICYSIARRHSAQIQFVSTPKGTKFIVYFPGGSEREQKNGYGA
ncbi:sporulation kinase [hydrocarbon metagenome]|uniref:Sporulation kinase n=1 Tax=hydrocarbon metagenome TaxID=938273 RepID=A0A0W8E6H1_9ZZZZ